MSELLGKIQNYTYWRWGLPFKRISRVFGPKSVHCTVRGLDINLVVSSDIEQYRADSFSSKEPETLDWIDRTLKPSDVFFDVGANIGLYSLYAAKRHPGIRVYSFEPESQNFSHLCLNIFKNKLQHVIPSAIPIAEAMRFSTFHVCSFSAGQAMHGFDRPSENRIDGAKSVFQQGMLGTSLDVLVYEFGLPVPKAIKIDVDGLEVPILRGAKRLLQDRQLASILVEATNTEKNPNEMAEIEEILTQSGFRVVEKGRPHTDHKVFFGQNVIFAR